MLDAAPAAGSRLVRPSVAAACAEPRAKLLLVGECTALDELVPGAPAADLEPNSSLRIPGLGVCLWLRPDQRLLLLSPGADADSLRKRGAAEAWVFDAGARFVEFELAGEDAAKLLSTGCSLDFRPAAFSVGRCAQTRFDRIPILIHRTAPECFEVLVERPLASHLWRWLCRAVDDL